MNTMIDYNELSLEDLPLALDLLKNSKLPYDDFQLTELVTIGAYENHNLIGMGAIQVCGNYGLLRSVVVAPTHRSKNIGKDITSYLIQKSIKMNLGKLFLLTETAEIFFLKEDFKVILRDEVPESIRQTSQFVSTCPASAVCMTREL